MVEKDNSILDIIGDTPTIRLSRIPAEEKIRADIFAKLEAFNPTESLKDRIYREMILGAIKRGDLKPGMEILEASTGNAGIACTFIGTRMGYRVTIVMPEGMSDERKKMIRAFGGDLILTPGAESDVDLCLDKIDELVKKNRGKYWVPVKHVERIICPGCGNVMPLENGFFPDHWVGGSRDTRKCSGSRRRA